LWNGGKKLKVLIPIILVLFMLQSCGGGNTDPEEEYDLVDVNPVVEEGEPDSDADDDLVDVNSVVEEGEPDDDDRRDDEYEFE